MPLQGDTHGPIYEAWELLAAWSGATTHVRLGTLVTGNTYRHPAVLANMVATLDHVSEGRSMLGLGAAWHEAEHAMYGIPFYTVPERLGRMDEAAKAIRMLLDLPVATMAGRYYRLNEAVCAPKPLQARLPLLIGGGGERRTLRTVARYADFWHGHGPPDVFAHKMEVLRRHCAEVGRDPDDITPLTTVRPNVILRDRAADARAHLDRVGERGRMAEPVEMNPIHTVDALVADLVERWNGGARGFLLYVHAPYDHETIQRIASEVRPRLEEAIA